MVSKTSAIVPGQFLSVITNGMHAHSSRPKYEDDMVTAIGWLVGQIDDPASTKTILDSVNPNISARIKSQIDFNNQITTALCDYKNLFLYLRYIVKNENNTDIPFSTIAKLQLAFFREQNSKMCKSVDIKKVYYLVSGSFKPVLQAESENIDLLPFIFNFLQFYQDEGYAEKATINDLEKYLKTIPAAEKYTVDQHHAKLYILMIRAKEVTGLLPFPANVE